MNRSFSQGRLREDNEQKKRCIKKILEISSIELDIRKLLLKLLKEGPKIINKQFQDQLFGYSKTILDRQNQRVLDECLRKLPELEEDPKNYFSNFFKIIKFNVLSPIERQYIDKIEEEIQVGNQIDEELSQLQGKIKCSKEKILARYKSEKYGKTVAFDRSSISALAKELNTQENKLQKVKQKLNMLNASNSQLRQKINQLRKQKNVMEEIKDKLVDELSKKKKIVDSTIVVAGQALEKRTAAENQLRRLKSCAEEEKKQFREQCDKMNQKIKEDIKFKQFLKSKQKERDNFAALVNEIRQNEELIRNKKDINSMLDAQYRSSSLKEEEVKRSYERIRKELSVPCSSVDKQAETILNIFTSLYEKNQMMTSFLADMTQEIQVLDEAIERKRNELQRISLRGQAETVPQTTKIQSSSADKRKRQILREQYELTVETISNLRTLFQKLFSSMGVPSQKVRQLKNSSMNRQCLQEYVGLIESKILNTMNNFARNVSEQLKREKNESPQLQAHINQLNNIIIYENAKTMSQFSNNIKHTSTNLDDSFKKLKLQFENNLTQARVLQKDRDRQRDRQQNRDWERQRDRQKDKETASKMLTLDELRNSAMQVIRMVNESGAPKPMVKSAKKTRKKQQR